MIDFRLLSHFAAACEHENLGSAAQEIGIAPSTLSASLKSLEAGFGVSLFRRHENGLAPRLLAHSLYRAAVSILLLEEFGRRRVRMPHEPIGRLTIDIRLRFAFGQLRRALANAIAQTGSQQPLLLVEPHWPLEVASSLVAMPLAALGFARESRLTIEAITRDCSPHDGEVVLRRDPWLLVQRDHRGREGGQSSANLSQPWMVPSLPPDLVKQITAYSAEHGRVLRVLDVRLDDWPQMLEDHPRAAFPLPSSAIGTRLGVPRVNAAPLDLYSTLIARPDGSPEAASFLDHLRGALEGGSPSRAFAPVLTERRVRYYNLAYEIGRLSTAAKTAGVAQPAMSQQLQKLEESVGMSLFDRSNVGLIRTETSSSFAVVTGMLENGLRELEMRGASAALEDGGRINLGVLPGSGHHGRLMAAITQAILGLRTQYPSLKLHVREAAGARLQRMVSQGQIGIAVVDEASSSMPRLSLEYSERLEVVAKSAYRLLPAGPVRFADLADIPMVLPTSRSGLRQVLDAEARTRGIKIQPTHEVDAVAMLLGLVSNEHFATVLPRSMIDPNGDLEAHPIQDPPIYRKVFVIHSGERSLTPAEREFVRLLRQVLGQLER